MEYIEREKVIDEIDKWLDSVGYVTVGKGLTSYGELIGCLEDTPTADVVEVRHGEWVKDRATIKCSCCGFGMFQDGYFFMDGECFSTNNDKYTPNYCPECGAKMDGKE